MQYELRNRVIEPKRQTYQYIIDRFGDKPASRYQEATLDVQPRENFHYRPTWDPERQLYDHRYSALRLSDPYSFSDPRQYYYTPYVTNRASLHDEFGKTLAYLEERGLLPRLPAPWAELLSEVVIPLRHYECGAQLVSVAGARFADGTSIEQCCSFAAFDRMGNAQMLSRIGIGLGQGSGEILNAGKQAWLNSAVLQPLRRVTEEAMIATDWAEGLLVIDALDQGLYPLLFQQLDDPALLGGAAAYSLLSQHLSAWYKDQRKWLDALVASWIGDPDYGEANRQELERIRAEWESRVSEATQAVAAAAEAVR